MGRMKEEVRPKGRLLRDPGRKQGQLEQGALGGHRPCLPEVWEPQKLGSFHWLSEEPSDQGEGLFPRNRWGNGGLGM